MINHSHDLALHTQAGNDISMHGYRQEATSQEATDHCHCDGRSGHPRHAGAFTDPTVSTVLTFGQRAAGDLMFRLPAGALDFLPLVKRQDRHEDGSIGTTYYLELTEDQYKALGGE